MGQRWQLEQRRMFEIPVTWHILEHSQITVSPNSQMCDCGFIRSVLGLIRSFHGMEEPAGVPSARCKTSLACARSPALKVLPYLLFLFSWAIFSPTWLYLDRTQES